MVVRHASNRSASLRSPRASTLTWTRLATDALGIGTPQNGASERAETRTVQTLVQTPLNLFNLPQRLLVPLFQRAYVWTEEVQWRPLWDDIRRQAERRLEAPGADGHHFLGAVVLQHQSQGAGQLPQHQIIDGQQRLTTLQIVFDAAHAVLGAVGQERIARRLTALTDNSEDFWNHPEDRFKVWPTNRDRPAYNEIMAAEFPIDYEILQHRGSLLVHAHAYFTDVIEEWVNGAGPEAVPTRCEQLAGTLMDGLRIVTITLDASEDSQAIFETLNARGTPLTAADLIKNFVFQRLAAEGVETERAYHDHWKFLEDEFWEKEVSVGRYLVSRSSLFFNQWLIAQTGEEVGPRATFTRFKHFVENEVNRPLSDLLPELNGLARAYRSWIERAAQPDGNLDPVTLAVYRTQAAGSEAIKPILLWLHDPQRPVPGHALNGVVGAVESWLMRRSLLRLPSADLGRVIADIIATHRKTDPALLGERVAAYLARQDRMSTYWPGDDEIRQALGGMVAYRRYPHGRLRMFLEAAEDHERGFTRAGGAYADSRVHRGDLHIEHLLPQSWKANWSVTDLAARIDREEHVHRLGNLTLLTSSLNSTVSNGSWPGRDGKLRHLTDRDVILMNRWIRGHGAEGWDEALIDQRTKLLVEALLATWPVPEGHAGIVRDARAPEPTWVEFRELVAAGLLLPGQVLTIRQGEHAGATAVVEKDGQLRIGNATFSTPSGAGQHVRGGATNGWYYWYLEDGRRLRDVREEYRRSKAAE